MMVFAGQSVNPGDAVQPIASRGLGGWDRANLYVLAETEDGKVIVSEEPDGPAKVDGSGSPVLYNPKSLLKVPARAD